MLNRYLLLIMFALLTNAASAGPLAEIYKQAQVNDADFAAAQAALRAGQEAYPQARAAALPTLEATASYTRIEREVEQTPFSNQPGSGTGQSGDICDETLTGPPAAPFEDCFDSERYGVELRQPLFDWGIPATLRQGKDRVYIAELTFAAEKKLLLARTMQRYIAFLDAAERISFARAELKALNEDLERAQARYEVGETGVTGLRESQAASDLAAARVIDSTTALDEAREELKQLTDRWYQRLPTIVDKLPLTRPDPSSPEDWVEIGLTYNATYLSAVREVDIAEDEISRKRAGYIPKVDLVAAYGESDDTEFAFGGASNDKSIGLEATWRLFSGGRTLSEIRETRALYDRSKSVLLSTQRRVSSDTRTNYRRVVQSISRVEAFKRAIVSARAALKATTSGFEVGERTQADVLDARRDVFRALTDHASARYTYLQNVVQLKLVAGVLSEEDLLRTDTFLEGKLIPARVVSPAQE